VVTVRVVIADDDPGICEALREVLAAQPGFEVLAVVGTGGEAVEVVGALATDVLVMDVRMPGGGASGVAAVRARSPGTAVVAISAQADARTIAGLLRSGEVGFMTKGQVYVELPALLRGCAAGAVTVAATTGAEALRLLAGGSA
jgi:DNA-binding NarL/FixJ family response regulator